MKRTTTEVLIVGAGPTGLLLACDLLRRGIPFRIIDRAEIPSQHSRAVALQARTLELLEDVGVLDRFLQQGLVPNGVFLYRDKTLESSFEIASKPTREVPHPYLLALEQHVTESILEEHLRKGGVSVERGLTLRRLCVKPDQVESWVESPDGGRLVRSSYLVGCDGAHSTVRRLSGITLNAVNAPIIYRLADLELEWEVPRDRICRFVTADKQLTAIPLSGYKRYRLNLWECEAPTPLSAGIDFGCLDTPPTLESFQSLLEEVVPGPVTARNPRSLLSYRTGHGVASRYSSGRVFLAGDAAHLLPQSAAQGMNTGLQDAYNLGWKLALVVDGDAPLALLESYQKERAPVAKNCLIQTRLDPSLVGRPGHLSSRENLDRWSQIHLHYRYSPIVFSPNPEAAVSAGDRAPDGIIAYAGEIENLYDHLDGRRHHLLVFSDFEDPMLEQYIEEMEALYTPMIQIHRIGLFSDASMDLDSRLHRVYSAQHGTLILVRPDRFVGARATPDQRKDFQRYLAGYLIPRCPADLQTPESAWKPNTGLSDSGTRNSCRSSRYYASSEGWLAQRI